MRHSTVLMLRALKQIQTDFIQFYLPLTVPTQKQCKYLTLMGHGARGYQTSAVIIKLSLRYLLRLCRLSSSFCIIRQTCLPNTDNRRVTHTHFYVYFCCTLNPMKKRQKCCFFLGRRYGDRVSIYLAKSEIKSQMRVNNQLN